MYKKVKYLAKKFKYLKVARYFPLKMEETVFLNNFVQFYFKWNWAANNLSWFNYEIS